VALEEFSCAITSSPGLSTRMTTVTFVGRICCDAAAEDAFWPTTAL